jgi:Zn-dependent protease
MGLDLNQLILFVPAFVIAISVHEASHAFSATLLGDPSPKAAGRLSLNPLRHLDPLGTIALLLAGFGWGKPVYVNPSAFRISPRTGMALTAVAGPLSNVVTAIVFGLFYRFYLLPSAVSAMALNRAGSNDVLLTVVQLVSAIIYINVMLAVFNLIPLPPLDGFSVLMGVLPRKQAMMIAPLARYGPGALLVLFLFVPYVLKIDLVSRVIGPPISLLFRAIVGR